MVDTIVMCEDNLLHLIELVKECPALYDPRNEDYIRTKLKEGLWNQIGRELNTTGETVKEQWRKLRDCHRDALRRQRKKRGMDGTTSVKMWAYQKQMAFLLSCASKRTRSTNISEDGGNNEPEDENQTKDIEQVQDSFEQPEEGEFSQVTSIQRKKFKSGMKTLIAEVEQLKQRFNERENLENRISEQPNDALYDFFMSMYKSTRNMTPSLQVQVKRSLFQAVSDAEDVMINNTQ